MCGTLVLICVWWVMEFGLGVFAGLMMTAGAIGVLSLCHVLMGLIASKGEGEVAIFFAVSFFLFFIGLAFGGIITLDWVHWWHTIAHHVIR